MADQPSDGGASTMNVAVESSESTGMANKRPDEGVSRANVAVGSSESSDRADKPSDEDVSRANVAVGSSESTGVADRCSDEGMAKAKVAVESSESTGSSDHSSDEDANRANVAVESSKSTGVADQHSDEGMRAAKVAVESSESTGSSDHSSDEDANTANVAVGSSESTYTGSTVEINIKTLDSQLHSFNVDKNMPVSKLKEKIASDIGLPVEQQRLIFRGKVLKDDDLLSEYHVENGYTLHLVGRQPSESQPSPSSPNIETTASSSSTEQDANATGTRPRVGHVSHSVLLGTFGVGDQNEGASPDIGQVIGAVLNSFGIGGQTPMGSIGMQPNMQFSIPVQVAQGNETGVSFSNQGQTGNQSQPRSPNQSMPQGSQTPLGTAAAVPTLSTPIPDSLDTLSEVMNHMEQALSQNGYQAHRPSNNTEGLSALELPSNARGLPSPATLAVVLRHAQRLLSGPVVYSLSHTAGRLEEEEGSTDVTVRTQIQTEAMQSGLAMQHLGALLLELGRTMLTLRIGQSPAESSVNAGPAVYISPSGPNPIMVQPFPLQTNSLFDGHATPSASPWAFGPIGVGAVPRHLNIHIHAGPSASNVESNQREYANGVESRTRGVGDNMRSGNEVFGGQADTGLSEARTDTGGAGNATSSSTRMKSVREMEGASSSNRGTSNSGNASGIPLGLGMGGLQPRRRHRQTRSEAGSGGASSSSARIAANQSLSSAGGRLDPATLMNQVMQNPALDGQTAVGSPDFLRNLLGQLTQNPAMMNTVNQLAQQMDGNQDLGSMFSGMGGAGGGSGSGSLDMSNMVQQMMPFVSQALSGGSSSSNLLQSVPSRKGELHRRYSSVKSFSTHDRSSDFQMNLENAAQKIEDEYPPLEVFSSVVETAAAFRDNIYDTGALAELFSEEELALEFMEMLKRDVSRRLQQGK